jgi:mRNA interferase MazF
MKNPDDSFGQDIYDIWNGEKKKLAFKENRKVYFQVREVWWCSIGQNLGNESNGKGKCFMRPVLIIKKLNVDTCVCVPLTTKQKYGSWYCEILLKNESRIALLNQIRMLHVRRFQRRIGVTSEYDLIKVKEKLRDLLELF